MTKYINDKYLNGGFMGERFYRLPTEVFTDFMEHPMLRRLYVTDAGCYLKANNHYVERAKGVEGSSENIFFYCMDGKGTVCVDGKKYRLKGKEAFCIPANHSHYYFSDSEDPWSILWVHFKGEDVSYYPLEEMKTVHFQSEFVTNRMMYLFELLFQSLEQTYSLGNFIFISKILALVLAETYIKENQECLTSQSIHVSNIVRYMNEHLSENLTLDGLAEKFALSKSYLNAIFHKYTKMSPIDLYISLKMTLACKMIKETDMYIYEVAQAVGYKDQYYFSRIFKKYVGVSPKEYKNGEYINYKLKGRVNL